MPKNIALFIDGTWNRRPGLFKHATNVYKLHEVTSDGPHQRKHYIAGVGTDWVGTSPKLSGGMTGLGTAERIREAYAFLSGLYEPGDRVYIFGFSRGAFAARSLAGFVNAVGLLLRKHATYENVARAYQLYEKPTEQAHDELRGWLHDLVGAPGPDEETALRIHLVGVWDTVSALGLPGRLAQFTAEYTEYHQHELPPNIAHGRHALALHELRATFEPALWTRRSDKKQTIKQVWFAGAHADVGGGYEDTHLSDIALDWMAQEARDLDLDLSGLDPMVSPYTAAPVHHEIRKWFYFSRPAARAALRNPRALGPEILETFGIHASACRRMLDASACAYTSRREHINTKLLEVDGLSLRMHLELCFRQALMRLPEWCRRVRIDDALRAIKVVCGEGTPDETEKRETALVLWILCGDTDVLRRLQDWLRDTESCNRAIANAAKSLPPACSKALTDAVVAFREEQRRSAWAKVAEAAIAGTDKPVPTGPGLRLDPNKLGKK